MPLGRRGRRPAPVSARVGGRLFWIRAGRRVVRMRSPETVGEHRRARSEGQGRRASRGVARSRSAGRPRCLLARLPALRQHRGAARQEARAWTRLSWSRTAVSVCPTSSCSSWAIRSRSASCAASTRRVDFAPLVLQPREHLVERQRQLDPPPTSAGLGDPLSGVRQVDAPCAAQSAPAAAPRPGAPAERSSARPAQAPRRARPSRPPRTTTSCAVTERGSSPGTPRPTARHSWPRPAGTAGRRFAVAVVLAGGSRSKGRCVRSSGPADTTPHVRRLRRARDIVLLAPAIGRYPVKSSRALPIRLC